VSLALIKTTCRKGMLQQVSTRNIHGFPSAKPIQDRVGSPAASRFEAFEDEVGSRIWSKRERDVDSAGSFRMSSVQGAMDMKCQNV